MSKAGDDWTCCVYCEVPLAEGRYEMDHMPVPARFGGDTTYPACTSCHDLKDRVMLGKWNSSDVWEGWANMGRFGRILMAKVAYLALEVERETEETSNLS
jgi:hypothetical protein